MRAIWQTNDLLRGRRDLLLNVIHDGGLRERAEVAKLVAFARDNLAEHATHDLYTHSY